ncbi:MAG: TraM recognition domain-containing protein [Patescibacteria group bacterium]|nr:TraM recognition domain-containing protein [Patescibacteria group bacterium]
MMVTKFQMDAMSRSDIPEEDRKDFYLYVDEFQNFATDSFATILSEARKYKLNLVMANQYIDQMQESVK